MSRSVAEIKRDIDKKYKEIRSVEKKIEAATKKLEREHDKMTHFGISDAESKILAMRRQKDQLQKDMEKIELEAYGTWIPRIRIIKAEELRKIEEREERARLKAARDRESRRARSLDGYEADS